MRPLLDVASVTLQAPIWRIGCQKWVDSSCSRYPDAAVHTRFRNGRQLPLARGGCRRTWFLQRCRRTSSSEVPQLCAKEITKDRFRPTAVIPKPSSKVSYQSDAAVRPAISKVSRWPRRAGDIHARLLSFEIEPNRHSSKRCIAARRSPQRRPKRNTRFMP